MEIYEDELKHLKGIEDIENIDIILNDKLSNEIKEKYFKIFEQLNDSEDFIESLPDMICFTIVKFKGSKNFEYWITNVVDMDGLGYQLDISKDLFFEILNLSEHYRKIEGGFN